MIPCPPLEMPEVTEEVWERLSPTQQASLEDGWAFSWAAQYTRCQASHDALIQHRKDLDVSTPAVH